MGVYAPALTEMFAKALHLLGVKKAFVVHGHDGMDEITTTDRTRVTELSDGQVKSYDLDPLIYFDDYAAPKDLQGGNARKMQIFCPEFCPATKARPGTLY